jgi:hypothetical protein
MTKKEMDLHQQNRFSIKINKILQDKKDNLQFLKLITLNIWAFMSLT